MYVTCAFCALTMAWSIAANTAYPASSPPKSAVADECLSVSFAISMALRWCGIIWRMKVLIGFLSSRTAIS